MSTNKMQASIGDLVMVTGAGGFIGSHLVELLVQRGYRVRAFTRYNSRGSRGWLDTIPPANTPAIEFVAGDVRDAHFVERAMDGCSAVFHLAALIAIPYSYDAFESYIQTNIQGTANVLKAALRTGAHVLQTSTSEVYGTAQYVPIDEAHPLNAQSPYAASKIGADQLALSFARSFGAKVTVVRPFNTYGPRQSVRAVIPSIITQALRGRKRVRLGALHPTRDFSFVGDTAAGFIAAMETSGALGRVVNLGSEFEVSIGRTLEIISGLLGVALEVEHDQQRMRPADSEVERLYANAALARDVLQFTPVHSGERGFEDGLRKTIDWFRSPDNLARFRADEYVV